MEIRCDRLLISRAVAKLIDNSIKFSSPGVAIMLATVMTSDNRFAIIVRDNGPGIAHDKIQSIGMPFIQSDMSLRRSKEGLGLGLPLVKAITASHDGTFLLNAGEDTGTQAIMLFSNARIVGGYSSQEDQQPLEAAS